MAVVPNNHFYHCIVSEIEASLSTIHAVLQECTAQIEETGLYLASTLASGAKIMLCGNGGSAADAQHIAAELVIRYRSSVHRRAFPALALTVDPSILTAGANDLGYENVFARQVEAYGRAGDTLVCISTTGNSPSVVHAAQTAQNRGIRVIGLLGAGGGTVRPLCDKAVVVPSDITARIQEAHTLVGHIWCTLIEETLLPELFA
ncbi:MAG: SIS domain-containing protein [Bacteroidota bacterium]|nr:SIS domain-containing protein [Candidatus Kapabacteria bacterium]MDW8219162.1 SIS domain-containing protein [Bacteroidota bacterium]